MKIQVFVFQSELKEYKGEYLPVLSMVILHVFEVCQMDEKVGKMVNGVKYPKS